ncbi:hypothetical protein [Arthrobacter bambusae]|nr:hypothetical protein [Arthrobacter bambusae]MDQ0241196.1 hypothetical protein [Arthrobacter bambusae]
MKILMMVLYSILTWIVLGTLGFGTWLGWAVLVMAVDISLTTIGMACRDD